MDGIRITAINDAALENKQKIEKLQESHDVRKTDQYEEQAKNAKKDIQVEVQEESLAISTLKYAYNNTTGDLVVKITNPDGSIGQYPTDSMMKLKSLLKEEFVNK